MVAHINMTSKRIVIAGGCALAFGAAFANTVVVLHAGTSVSHLTGDIAMLTIDLARWSPDAFPDIHRVVAAAAGFFLGATFAGALIHHPVFDVSRPYGRSVTGIGILFLLSSFFLPRHPVLGIGFAAFGCGIQNALASHYRGLILRTTHLTGMFTDMGITLGMRLRGYDVPTWKIAVPAWLICSFFMGGVSAAWMHFAGYKAMVLAGGAYCLAGILWSISKHALSRHSKHSTRNP